MQLTHIGSLPASQLSNTHKPAAGPAASEARSVPGLVQECRSPEAASWPIATRPKAPVAAHRLRGRGGGRCGRRWVSEAAVVSIQTPPRVPVPAPCADSLSDRFPWLAGDTGHHGRPLPARCRWWHCNAGEQTPAETPHSRAEPWSNAAQLAWSHCTLCLEDVGRSSRQPGLGYMGYERNLRVNIHS